MVLDERTVKDAPVWQHMTQVVGAIVQQRPREALDVVESFSHFAKEGKLVPDPASTVYQDTRPKPKQAVPANAAEDTEWARAFALQVNPPKPPKKADDEEEPVVAEDKGELPDIVSEQATFRLFGYGLGEVEAYRITVALKRLLDVEPLAKVRFWGKINGVKKDYYICEAKIDEARVPEKPDDNQEEPPEAVGKPSETIFQSVNTYRAPDAPRVTAEDQKGVNEYKYYVATSDDITAWVQLPDVLPNQVVVARKICKFFSGNLDAQVECHPPFPGVERHYLRAQIARISHATTVCPRQIYYTDEPEAEEENEDGTPKEKRFQVEPYEEMPPLNTQEAPDAEDAEAVAPLKMWFYGYVNDELLEPKNWAHLVPQMLDEGRVTKFKPEAAENEDDEPVKLPDELINPFLSDLSHDRQLTVQHHSKEAFPAWATRKAYCSPSAQQREYLARSLLWPGAVCYAVAEDEKPGARYQNCYFGYGVKDQLGKVYAPVVPPLPSVEFPTPALRLQKDCSRDDELEFEPAPPPPVVEAEEGEEGLEEE